MTQLSSFVTRALPDVPGCPLPLVEQAVRDSIKDFIDRTWTVSEGFSVSVASVSAADVGTLDLSSSVPTNHKIIHIASFKKDGVPYPLFQMDIQAEGVSNIENTSNRLFYEISGDSEILLYPVSSGDEYHGSLICIPKDAATEVADKLFDEWVEPIVAGAKWRLFIKPDKPWTRFDLVKPMQVIERRGMVRANRRRNKNRTGKSLEVRPRSFFNNG